MNQMNQNEMIKG